MRHRYREPREMTAAICVLKNPGYVVWLLGQRTGDLREARRLVIQLFRLFNSRPFFMPCRGSGCRNRATRCSLSRGSVKPRWWCDSCDPQQQHGSSPANLEIVRTYREAIRYVKMHCRGFKGPLKTLIRAMARGKGLADRVGEREAEDFFCGS
jgi:hypothetical protein